EKSPHLRTCTGETRHDAVDGNGLYVRDFAIAEAPQHNEKKRGALLFRQARKRAFDVGLRPRGLRHTVLVSRSVQRALGQDREEAASNVSTAEQILGLQRMIDGIADQLISRISVMRPGPGVLPERWDRTLQLLPERSQIKPGDPTRTQVAAP